jgi:hypothetical protein
LANEPITRDGATFKRRRVSTYLHREASAFTAHHSSPVLELFFDRAAMRVFGSALLLLAHTRSRNRELESESNLRCQPSPLQREKSCGYSSVSVFLLPAFGLNTGRNQIGNMSALSSSDA